MWKISKTSNEMARALSAALAPRQMRGWVGPREHSTLLRTMVFLLVAGFLGIGSVCQAAELPSATAIPIQFTHTLEAGKVTPGTPAMARTTQAVLLPRGQVIPKGATVVGRVIESRSFHFDPAPYAIQEPSYLSIHFDKIAANGGEIPLNVSVRALADNLDADDASYPHRLGDSDPFEFVEQIGGDQYPVVGKELLSSDGDIVGYIRKQGVFGRLLSNTSYRDQSSSFHCDSTTTEQSLGIFSPAACGLYGFDSLSLPANGRKDGTFRLESRHHTVKLYAGSAALLEVN